MSPEHDSRQSKGGNARRDSLTPSRRAAIAKKAAEARWSNPDIDLASVPSAICGAPDKPLRIGDVEIPCYVLDGGKRVIHQRGMVSALGMSRGGSSRGGGDRLAYFVAQKTLSSFVSSDLLDVTAKPLLFKTPKGALAYGYEATILAEICEAILKARQAGVLSKQQDHIANKAEIPPLGSKLTFNEISLLQAVIRNFNKKRLSSPGPLCLFLLRRASLNPLSTAA